MSAEFKRSFVLVLLALVGCAGAHSSDVPTGDTGGSEGVETGYCEDPSDLLQITDLARIERGGQLGAGLSYTSGSSGCVVRGYDYTLRCSFQPESGEYEGEAVDGYGEDVAAGADVSTELLSSLDADAHQVDIQCSIVVADSVVSSADYAFERCDDGVDNDGDGLADCDDPDCGDGDACFDVASVRADLSLDDEGVTIDLEGPSGTYLFGIAQPHETVRDPWNGEDCHTFPTSCHPVTPGETRLDRVSLDDFDDFDDETLFAAQHEEYMAYVLFAPTGYCWTWGAETDHYDELGCEEPSW